MSWAKMFGRGGFGLVTFLGILCASRENAPRGWLSSPHEQQAAVRGNWRCGGASIPAWLGRLCRMEKRSIKRSSKNRSTKASKQPPRVPGVSSRSQLGMVQLLCASATSLAPWSTCEARSGVQPGWTSTCWQVRCVLISFPYEETWKSGVKSHMGWPNTG